MLSASGEGPWGAAGKISGRKKRAAYAATKLVARTAMSKSHSSKENTCANFLSTAISVSV